MKAVRRVPVVDQVVSSLKEYIMSGNINAGDKMPTEMELCEQLKVGRGTVREAMRILQATGFVEIQAGRGAFVASTEEPGKEDLVRWFQENEIEVKDCLEVRAAIEPLAIRLACQRRDELDIETLRAIHERTLLAVTANDAPEIAQCDEDFHTYLVECSRNNLLISINRQISEYLKNFRHKTFYIPSNVQNLIEPHSKILQAVVEGNAAEGGERMLAHLDKIKQDLERSKKA